MADVTLTSDTLYSSVDADLTDGDTIYCDGYRLTIDTDVVKAIDFNPTNGGEIYCENTATDTIRYINSASNYYFSTGDGDGKITLDGGLMSLGSVDANGQLAVSVDVNMARLFAVYVPSLEMWFFETTDYGSSVDTNYILPTYEKPLFSYDADTQTLSFNYRSLPEGTEIQFPNIVIHRSWAVRAGYNKLNLYNHYWNASGVLIYAPFVYVNNSERQQYFYNSILIQNDTTYKTIPAIYMENCALGATSYYYGAIRTHNTQNLYLKDCTVYPRWQWGGWCRNNIIENCKLMGDFTSDPFPPSMAGLKIIGGTWVIGRTSVTTDAQDITIDGVSIRGAEDPEYTPPSTTYYPSFRASGNNQVFVLKGCQFGHATGHLFNSSYLNGNYCVALECTKYDTAYWNYGLIGNLRFFNNTSTTSDGSLIPLRTSDGVSFMPNHLIVGHRGNCSVSIDKPGAAVLDFRNGVENVNATYMGTINAYDSDAASWVMFTKAYGDDVIGERVFEITELFHNFWDDVATFDSYEKYNTYNVDFRFSYNGEDWYIWDDFAALPVPPVVNLYLKVIATNGSTIFNGIKFYYTRKSNWVEYPNVWRDQTIVANQFSVTDPMNMALWHSRWNTIIDRTVSDGSSGKFTVWYDDISNWTYTIRVRKYGYEFGDVAFVAEPEFTQTGYYIGQLRTDLTMAEVDAAAITDVVLQPSSDAEYAWELDCGGKSLEDAYHYCQYKLTNFGEWSGVNTFELSEFLQRDGEMFKTLQARAGEGVKLTNYTGKVSGFTKDDGSTYTPPVDVLMTVQNIVPGSSVYIYTTDDATLIYKGIADTDTVTASISGLADKPYEIVIRKSSEEPRYIEWSSQGTIGTVDINITANQQRM